jgi:hypothetical protein
MTGEDVTDSEKYYTHEEVAKVMRSVYALNTPNEIVDFFDKRAETKSCAPLLNWIDPDQPHSPKGKPMRVLVLSGGHRVTVLRAADRKWVVEKFSPFFAGSFRFKYAEAAMMFFEHYLVYKTCYPLVKRLLENPSKSLLTRDSYEEIDGR